MNVRFFSANPRERARPTLDSILAQGVDQVAIGCAFLTGGGAEVIKRHSERLRLPDSFLVVAWEPPTSLEALTELHAEFPQNLYIHLGVKTPVEKLVGRGLMHSKVFFARKGDQCWLWVGSHNLTASAMQGVNCEAAVLLEGTMVEEPFKNAIAHLNQLRKEAVLFDPRVVPPLPNAEQTVVIHAELHAMMKPHSWFVHLLLGTTDYDKALRPPAAVWLYLYQPGELRPGTPRPRPTSAHSGLLTALNFTKNHPNYPGIAGDWQAADYTIEAEQGIFKVTERKPHGGAVTQCVFRVDSQEDPEAVWLTGRPTITIEPVVGHTTTEDVDRDLRSFFTKQSVQGGKLIRREYRTLKIVYRVSRKEVGQLEADALRVRLELPSDTEIELEEIAEEEDKFVYIYRAKYRV